MLVARGLRRLDAAGRHLEHQAFVPPLRAASGLGLLGAGARFHDYDAAITACVERKALREGQQVHARMITARYRPQVYLATRLVTMYAQCGALEDARNVFDRMPERSVVSWSAMISGYSQTERRVKAFELFIEMRRAGFNPNEFTLSTVLTSCSGPLSIKQVEQVHSLIVKTNFESHMFVGSSLLDMYAKSENIQEARRVFDMLPERDVVSCTAIISGYAHQGLDEEALNLFRRLYSEGMQCNHITFMALVTALSGLASLDYGKQVHAQILRKELPFYIALQNSLIDMYSKCGKLLYARRIFDNMPERSVVSWNAMLMGYGRHGFGHEVVRIFKNLRKEAKPDSVTLLAVLSGCSHGGLVDEGLDMFDIMVKEQSELLHTGHYGCVIDLLGRSGRLEKALNLIENMPLEPTPSIWGSLLGACRVHANVHVGELVAQKLLEMEPENAGNYVILSNIYAASGMWKDVFKVRKLMLENTVTKEPGQSWIILDKVIHTFLSSDEFHPSKKDIDAKIKEIFVDIKAAGFVPDLSCVLHDVDDEQKERMLLGHSEKLAITFGLMNTPSGLTIRIMKNLRICVDCHNFAKFVSKVYGREISLRDKNRFHLLAHGNCTCGDYW
ncbi:putative pentatricopeptide repeat-containing protein At3g13770, mitochondrial [Oryza brachyantha]|nr:putative pentatricopeptide repeat-containing protein At3g13770, mitochondrial [Oryza brachyantha]XP_015694390.1 putative pentatricopeptide repeat-containing protein At3g13770, mitochondrial [Oryza brachyantha]XP_015694391.1 putative pentatricopeptide repeat-containing protein At3g13770, mitochondrial [Oryza brachyantha]